ncbi:hypothetical protein C8R44DRAFT_812330 [Mycena epipterygia]|nr:hypothetical protein C8R44DRAFT_812330 [Mycena epipterygia]
MYVHIFGGDAVIPTLCWRVPPSRRLVLHRTCLGTFGAGKAKLAGYVWTGSVYQERPR